MFKKIVAIAALAILLVSTGGASAPFINKEGKRPAQIMLKNASENRDKLSQYNKETEYWAVVVGIGDYDGKHDLPLNATCIYDSLLPAKNWNETHIKLLIDENATKTNILGALDWLSEKADSNDIILFSYQGHGNENNLWGEAGIVPWEGMDGFITVGKLDEKFDGIDAKGMHLIFDCCLSGSFVDKKNVRLVTNTKKFRGRFTAGIEGNGRVIVMSTMKGGLGASIEIEIDNTTRVLTLSNLIADALDKTVDYNKDSICSAEEVFTYAKIRFFPFAILLLNPIWQLKSIIATGHPILAFPTIYDGYNGKLPIVIHE